MKAKPHTPGVFRAIRHCNTPMFTVPDPRTPAKFEIVSQEGNTLAVIESYNYPNGTEEAEANARLFAASPELLKVCKNIVNSLNIEDRHLIVELESAIFSATGETLKEVKETYDESGS